MATVSIVHVSHLPSAELTRQGKTDAIVIYSVDGGPPGTIIMPAEDLSEDKVRDAIAKQVGQKTDLQGKTITI